MRDKTDCAYAAGFIDGEGYIGIAARIAGKAGRRHHVVVFGVANCHRETLVRLQAVWGGTITAGKAPANKKWNVAFHLRWTGHAASHMLAAIRPFLVTKAGQCDLALQLASRKSLGAVTETEWDERERLRLAIQSLNRRRNAKHTEAIPFMKPLSYSRSCPVCGGSFECAWIRKKYCSNQCRKATRALESVAKRLAKKRQTAGAVVT